MYVPNGKLQWPVRGRMMMAIAAAAPMEKMFSDGMVAKGLAIVLRSVIRIDVLCSFDIIH